jgi:CUG-BP- and ETR3-like factor
MPDNRQIFFARVLRSATEEAVRALFTRFGHVSDINLFRAFQVGLRGGGLLVCR